MNCKLKTTTLEGVPQWAVTYIVNGDGSGLNGEDLKMVDDWLDNLRKSGIVPLCPIDGSENEFSPYPAFGLGSNTVDFEAEILPSEWKVTLRETMECIRHVKAHSAAEAIRIAKSEIAEGVNNWDTVGNMRARAEIEK